LPAVIDDVCRPIVGQFPITLRYVAEKIGEVHGPAEIVRMRGMVWRTWADEVNPGCVTKSLETRLSMTLLEEWVPHWDARATLTRLSAEARGLKPDAETKGAERELLTSRATTSIVLETPEGRKAATVSWKKNWSTPERKCTNDDLTETAFGCKDRPYLNQWQNGRIRLADPNGSQRVQSIEKVLIGDIPPKWHPESRRAVS